MQDKHEAGRISVGQKYQGQGRTSSVQDGDGQRSDAMVEKAKLVMWGTGKDRPPKMFADEQRYSRRAQYASYERTERNRAVACDVEPWPGAASWTWHDRSCWPDDGPWDGEPDKVLWKHDASGFPLMAVRAGHHGAWCGYVGVPKGHWAHGLGYDDVEERFHKAEKDSGAHCGLTFANHCMEAKEGEDAIKLVCHPTDHAGEEDEVWWLGFDCSHCDDMRPMDSAWMHDTLAGLSSLRMDYRDLPYVRSCCEDLAKNLTRAP